MSLYDVSLQESRAIAQKTARCALYTLYGNPEKFRESLATPTATFPEIVNGLLL